MILLSQNILYILILALTASRLHSIDEYNFEISFCFILVKENGMGVENLV